MENIYKTPGGIEYSLQRRRRKTVAIKIIEEGIVIVSIPLNCSRKLAEGFIDQKSNWISLKREEALKSLENKPKLKFLQDKNIEIVGIVYRIKLHTTAKSVNYIVSEKQDIDIYLSEKLHEEMRTIEAGALLKRWLIKRAQEIFLERTAFYSSKMSLMPNRITIKDQKTLWGSCSSKNNLNFNWKLVTAPLSILDYVVVHELCHMVHRNHSKDYWDYVQQFMPDYKEKIQWLKKNGSLLGI